MFLVSAIMLFFLPEKINILHNGDTYYPIPSILGIWLVPVISLVLNFTFIKQKKLSSLNSINHGITSHWKYHILYYFDIVKWIRPMKKTLNIILFGRKKSYFVKCTLTLIGLYLGVLFWYFNVDYLGTANTKCFSIGCL